METTTRPGARQGTLNEVRAVVPPSCYGRSPGPAVAALLQAAVLYAAPVTALALTDAWWLLAVLWPLAGLGVAGLFVLGHDASHGVLVHSPRRNRLIARLCMGPSLHAEAAWDLGHNRIHHGYTTRRGFDFVWHPATAEEYRDMSRRARARHRVEWSWLGAGAYFLRVVWWEKMWRFSAPGARHDAIQRDKVVLGTVAAAVLVATAVAGGVHGGWVGALWLPAKLFVIPFLLFAQIIGWTVYVHHIAPDIRWWTRRDWSQFKGQMESTTVVRMPKVANRLWLHNIFVHVPHHVDTRIRFDHLPRAAAAIEAAFPHTVRTRRLHVGRYLATTRACKLYDFEAGLWTRYSGAR